MQDIKITEEMKNDAVKLINALDVFRTKYGLPMLMVEAFTYEKHLTICGDRDENYGFDAFYIYADGATKISHID